VALEKEVEELKKEIKRLTIQANEASKANQQR